MTFTENRSLREHINCTHETTQVRTNFYLLEGLSGCIYYRVYLSERDAQDNELYCRWSGGVDFTLSLFYLLANNENFKSW